MRSIFGRLHLDASSSCDTFVHMVSLLLIVGLLECSRRFGPWPVIRSTLLCSISSTVILAKTRIRHLIRDYLPYISTLPTDVYFRSQFLCRLSNKCIPFWTVCDGHNDCGDSSDEPNTCPPYHCRTNGLFQCHDASEVSLFIIDVIRGLPIKKVSDPNPISTHRQTYTWLQYALF